MKITLAILAALVLVGCACDGSTRRLTWQPIPQIEKVQTTPMTTVSMPMARPAMACPPSYPAAQYPAAAVPPTYRANPCP